MTPDRQLVIEEDIRRATTLPGWVYTDPAVYARIRERVFARSWQLVGDLDRVKVPGQVAPFTLLEGLLDEPLLLTRDEADDAPLPLERLHASRRTWCPSTRRSSLSCAAATTAGASASTAGSCRCPSSSRRENFPGPADDLPRGRRSARGRKFLFASLDPGLRRSRSWLADMRERVRLAADRPTARSTPARSRDYLVRANWALYCDNYLEGFHIPFVHAGAEPGARLRQLPHRAVPAGANLQLGDRAATARTAFDAAAPARRTTASASPPTTGGSSRTRCSTSIRGACRSTSCGRSAVDRTRVSFLSYVCDPSRLDRGAGGAARPRRARGRGGRRERAARRARRGSTSAAATRRRASRACTTSIACWPGA